MKLQAQWTTKTYRYLGLEFRKQQVAGSIPITGSIFMKLNQADFGKAKRSLTEECPPIFNLA